jgi:hypothetical protein
LHADALPNSPVLLQEANIELIRSLTNYVYGI